MNRGSWTPAVDIYEIDGALVLKAELPDMRREDIDVSVENHTLTIRGERKLDNEIKQENFHRIERAYGSFVAPVLAAANRGRHEDRRRVQERRAERQAAGARGSQAADRSTSKSPRNQLDATSGPRTNSHRMGGFLLHTAGPGALPSGSLADHRVPGITVASWAALALAALVLGPRQRHVRPVLVILTLPITVLTLGLFYLVVNGVAFGLAAALVPGFHIAVLVRGDSRRVPDQCLLLVHRDLRPAGLTGDRGAPVAVRPPAPVS